MYIPDRVPDDDRERMLEKGGYGHTIEPGETVAVIVVDMTREFVEDRYPNGDAETGKPAARAISDLVDATRDSIVRAYYSRSIPGNHPIERGRWKDTTSGRDDPAMDEAAFELADELSPTDDDVVFDKYKPSVFFGTQLESMLTHDGVDTVIVTGMTTSGCVRATVIDAFSYNYRVLIPEECVADRARLSGEINLFDMDMKYADVRPMTEIVAAITDAA